MEKVLTGPELRTRMLNLEPQDQRSDDYRQGWSDGIDAAVDDLATADEARGLDRIDVDRMARGLIAHVIAGEPLLEGEVIVSVALDPDDPDLLAGKIAEIYDLGAATPTAATPAEEEGT